MIKCLKTELYNLGWVQRCTHRPRERGDERHREERVERVERERTRLGGYGNKPTKSQTAP